MEGMATVQKTIYICDICKKEFADKDNISSIELPCKISDSEGRSYTDAFRKVDACKECVTRFRNIVYEQFAVVRDTLGSVEVKRMDIKP